LIPSLLEELQNRLARPLSPGEQETIVYLYTYLQLKPEYLLLVTEYCRSKNKANMRYIEKTVLEWVDKGIDTHDRAEAYLQELDRRESNEGLIQTMFGIQGRELSSREKDFIETWFQTYHFSEEMIRLAYERTVDNTGKISFPYLNKILSQWFEKGIHTPADAEQEMGTRKAVGNTASQATYDLDEIQRIMELNSSQ
jgi:DnaD/phage-associated family protein